MNFGVPWSPEEDRLILDLYHSDRCRLLALMPARTRRAIGERASKLGCTGPNFRGPNQYLVTGAVAVIFLERRDGSVAECRISSRHLERVITFGRWRLSVVDHLAYVMSKGIALHRFLLDCPAGREVDHIDGDGLNNVDGNIRVVTRAQNTQNKSLLSRNAKSGYRGVYYHPTLRLWVARLAIGGKAISRYAKTKEAAIERAAELRREFHPYAARG